MKERRRRIAVYGAVTEVGPKKGTEWSALGRISRFYYRGTTVVLGRCAPGRGKELPSTSFCRYHST